MNTSNQIRAQELFTRIKKLIALTESPNEHESRTAALLAIKLILKHNIPIYTPPAGYVYTLTQTGILGLEKLDRSNLKTSKEILESIIDIRDTLENVLVPRKIRKKRNSPFVKRVK